MKRQLIPRIWGGLGNQMFVYAAARSLAETMGADLMLDTSSGFARDHLYRREYLLDQFFVPQQLAPAQDCFLGRTGWIREQLIKRLYKLGVGNCAFVGEGENPLAVAGRKIFLRGYWQSESCFAEHAEIIRHEFRTRESLSASSVDELHSIKNSALPIAIGLRRFAEVPKAHGAYVLGAEYYAGAIAEMERRFPGATFFIFTEDVGWARGFLQTKQSCTFISHKEGNRHAFENLTLMQQCRHFVVGNSTYHWWGAWLGERADSLVIAPAVVAERTPAFYPQRWMKL